MKMSVFLCMLMVVLLFCGCSDRKEAEQVRIERPAVSGVEVAEAGLSEIGDFYETSGTLTAQTTSRVASRMMGVITEVLVREGERVKAGQLLATLDDRDVRQKVAAADAALSEAESGLAAAGKQKELAEITWQRYANLFEGKALTGQELDQARTARDVASLEYARLERMIDRVRAGRDEAGVYREFTRITSPVTGVVTSKEAELGTMAMPGMVLFTIEDNTSLTLDLWVSESLAGRLEKESPVRVAIAAPAAEFKGRILDVVPSVDPRTRTFLVKVTINGDGLRSGQHATARIGLGSKSVLLLPNASIVRKGQLSGVYVVNEADVLSYRLVRLGRDYDGKTEILTGLVPGEKIVVAGVDRAKDGGILSEEQK
ncbi:MAG: efflux RND transporter periplasmic adaptor subunit [Pseudomonadota bacterium]